jgi:hypothetical protein
MICFAAAKTTQADIDKSNPPPPENPEDRAISQIVFFQDWLKDHPQAPTRTKLHIARQISRLEVIVKEWMPTKYRPDRKYKGGKG